MGTATWWQTAFEFLRWLIGATPLAAALVGVFLEGSAVPFPSAVLLVVLGTSSDWQPGRLALAATWAALAYTSGAIIPYAVGRLGRHLTARRRPGRHSARLARLDALFHRYGQWAVLWTRPLLVGNFISIPAGAARMHPVRFAIYTFVGIWPWTAAMLGLGASVTSGWVWLARLRQLREEIEAEIAFAPWTWFLIATSAVLTAVLVGWAIVWLRRRRIGAPFGSAARQPTEATADPAQPAPQSEVSEG